MIFLFNKCSCQVPSNFTSYEAQSETNLAFPYLCAKWKFWPKHFIIQMLHRLYYFIFCFRGEDEDAVAFANRVKAEIARQGGLVDLMW